MPSIQLVNASFAFNDAAPLLADVTLRFEPGFHGVAGANGAGKTTLLRLLAGELAPTGGAIVRTPPGLTVALCPQRVDDPDDAIESLAWRPDRAAHRLRAQLGLDPAALARWDTLSPGERKRWQLGGALVDDPDALLLDEPTNHLDEAARARLIAALGRYRGVAVIVSHDRALLDALCTRTVRVHAGHVSSWPVGYDEARAIWEADARAAIETRDAQRDALRAARGRLGDARRRLGSAEAQRSSSARMKGPRDSDARGALAKGMVAFATTRLARDVAVLREDARRAEGALEEAERAIVDKPLGGPIALGAARGRKPIALALDRDVVLAGETPLLRDVHLTLPRGARVWLTGPNGAGKSTLMRAMLADSASADDEAFHLPQELSLEEGRAILDDVRARPADARGALLALVATLGVDPARLLASGTPSPGEARKLALAEALSRPDLALLALDEPENHLDLPAIEALEAALDGYRGALLLITHDPWLARRCTTERWSIEDERIVVRSTA
jgi:ATPase subunit of ABC transporter with duplicated ATPase domains